MTQCGDRGWTSAVAARTATPPPPPTRQEEGTQSVRAASAAFPASSLTDKNARRLWKPATCPWHSIAWKKSMHTLSQLWICEEKICPRITLPTGDIWPHCHMRHTQKVSLTMSAFSVLYPNPKSWEWGTGKTPLLCLHMGQVGTLENQKVEIQERVLTEESLCLSLFPSWVIWEDFWLCPNHRLDWRLSRDQSATPEFQPECCSLHSPGSVG